MLSDGPHPDVAANELAAVAKLREKNPNAAISYARRDEDEGGPLLVHVDGDTYTVQADGATRKKTK